MKLLRPTIFLYFLFILFAVSAKAAVAGPKFTLTPATSTVKAGETVNVTVGIATGDVKSTMYDVVLTFDATKVDLTTAVLDSFASSDYDMAKTIDNATGKFTANIYSKNTIFDQKTFNGNLLKLTFTGKVAGNSTIAFVCTSGSYNDSNILYVTNNGKDSVDKVNCSENDTATLTVSGTSTGGSVATPTTKPTKLPTTGTVEITFALVAFGIVSVLAAGSILRL